MFDYGEIRQLDLEASSLCNAECPSCGRRASGGLKNTIMTETYVSLEQAKEWFTEDFIKGLRMLSMCGNYGDSMTNPDLIPILKYFRSCNPDIELYMNTNASGRDAEFWQDLGNIFKHKGCLVFSVDGLEDTNWIYRKGTHWDKIMTAMTNYISTGAEARWEFLVFRHNQHQIEEATELSKKLGFKQFYAKKAMGFTNFTDSSGKWGHDMKVHGQEGHLQYTIKPPIGIELEQRKWDSEPMPEPDSLETGYLEDIKKQLAKSVVPLTPIKWHHNPTREWKLDKTVQLSEYDKKLSEYDINCEAIAHKKIFVNSYGMVFPCCYLASIYDDQYGQGDTVAALLAFINRYGKDSISLQHTSLKDIIGGEMYTTGYLESFEDRDIRNKRLKACSVFCGKETEISKTKQSMLSENNLI